MRDSLAKGASCSGEAEVKGEARMTHALVVLPPRSLTVLPFRAIPGTLAPSQPYGASMNAAGARKRFERLTALIEGFHKEAEVLLADRSVLTPEQLDRYLTAIYNAKDGRCTTRIATNAISRVRAPRCQMAVVCESIGGRRELLEAFTGND